MAPTATRARDEVQSPSPDCRAGVPVIDEDAGVDLTVSGSHWHGRDCCNGLEDHSGHGVGLRDHDHV